ncbi:hypothetical protein [Crenobacter cavernae]|uniref:Carboxypeptidase regulatory-like domain-containing protein n=1 Tax=Crenobacter cavernae TaxID=2290923 RepID=A0ABY0FGJ9_9NEIS|nr:hypothetical protein [Crenobacter cavernae]RXZ44261.1 hypothetical protein EBB06_06915 [Crenobacter cavernae]
MNTKRAAACAALLLATGGCVSRHWTAPEADGVVYDQRTGRPLPGVEVYRQLGRYQQEGVGSTGLDGRFLIQPERSWKLMMQRTDPGYFGSYVFRKDGYVSVTIPYGVVTGGATSSRPPGMGTQRIELKPER